MVQFHATEISDTGELALLTAPRSPSIANSAPLLTPRRALNGPGLAAVTFFCVAGGAFGLEDAVGAGGPLIVLLAILILPWLWSFPTALMTAELSTALPEDGGYVVWDTRSSDALHGGGDGGNLYSLLAH
jgi:hypothetical protein